MIFEQVPGVVNSSASVTATDLTADKVIAAGTPLHRVTSYSWRIS